MNTLAGRPRGCSFALSLILLAVAHGLLDGRPLQAQATPSAATFIAIPDRFPDVEARAMVVREPGRDVIVLDPDEVSTDAFLMSLIVLERLKALDPTPVVGQMVPITGFVVDTPASGHPLRRLETALDRLRDRPVTDLGTLGSGRWMRYSPGGSRR